MTGVELTSLPLGQARDSVVAGEVSSVDLTRACIERIRQMDNAINAFTHVFEDSALARAAELDTELGQGSVPRLLHGVPVALKDLCDVVGETTTASSAARSHHVAVSTAFLVEKLEAAGAVLVGKTQTHEFAYGALTPQTMNPVSEGRIAGGSSGGSAAALAANMVFGAVGSDTGGSIRIPAALCGVAGLKPTYGRVGRTGTVALSWSLDHFGPMARRVRDLALMLEAMAGHDPGDNASSLLPVPAYSDRLDPPDTGLRIGVPRNLMFEDIEPAIAERVRFVIERLEAAGCRLVDIELPHVDLYNATEYGIFLPEAASYHESLLKQAGDRIGADVRALLEVGLLVPANHYLRAQRTRELIRSGWAEVLRTVDVVVGPTVPAVAARIGQAAFEWPTRSETVMDGYMRLCCPSNLTGCPSLTVPVGNDPDGHAIGFQIIGRPFEEEVCFQVGVLAEAIFTGSNSKEPQHVHRGGTGP